jgi:peptidoglycan/xylan/chitin deacetylase (PgdA/CDA1 family)
VRAAREAGASVTVVIPTRNRWERVPHAVAAALAQRDVAVEVVVVDDGSEWPPPELLASDRVRLVAHERRRGVAAARNTGVAAARAPWVAFLDDDDLWAPDKLASQLAAATAADAGFAYGGALALDERGAVLRTLPAPDPATLAERLLRVNAIPAGSSNVVARTALVREAGGFDESFDHLDDWDMWIRLAQASAAARCERPVVAYVQERGGRAAGRGAQLMAELDRLAAKHPAASFDRVDYARWLAVAERRAGRRRAAAALYVAERTPGGALRAAAALSGAAGARERLAGRKVAPEWAALPAAAREARGGGAAVGRGGGRARGGGARREGGAAAARGGGAGAGGSILDAAARRVGAPAGALAARALRLSARRVGVALVLHRVGDPQGDLRRDVLPALGTELFERHLRFLAAHFDVVDAHDLLDAVRARRRGRRFPVAITFDDDLASHARVALPILRRAGVRATFFLCGTPLTGGGAFWWEHLQAAADRGALDPALVGAPRGERDMRVVAAAVEALPRDARDRVTARLRDVAGDDVPHDPMTAADVEALVRAGCSIGHHTLCHENLTRLPDAELPAAIAEGRDELERAAGRPLRAIAYPYGAADARVRAAAADAGFAYGFTTSSAAILAGSDPLALGRLEPSYDSTGRLALQLARRLLLPRRA